MPEPLGDLDDLPQVLAGLTGGLDHLHPVLGAPLGVAEHPLLLDPHGRGENQVGDFGRAGRVGLGDDDEAPRLARPLRKRETLGAAWKGLLHCTQRKRMSPRSRARSISVAWKPGLGGMRSTGTFQILAALARCSGFMTTMSAGSRWAKVPTSRAVPQAEGWPVSENGPLAGLGDLAGQQVDVVDEVVDPGAAGVLVEAHGPVGADLALGIGVEAGELLDGFRRHAGDLLDLLRRVVGEKAAVLLEVDRLPLVLEGEAVLQAVADMGLALLEDDLALDERLVVETVADDDVGDAVGQRQVGLGAELDVPIRLAARCGYSGWRCR